MNEHAELRPEIICRPDLQAPIQKSLSSGLSLIGWGLWFYLLSPLLTLIAWAVGAGFFTHQMISFSGDAYNSTLRVYAGIIASMGVMVFAWSRYNLTLSSRYESADAVPAVNLEGLSERFQLTTLQIKTIHESLVVHMSLDEAGSIKDVQSEINSLAFSKHVDTALLHESSHP